MKAMKCKVRAGKWNPESLEKGNLNSGKGNAVLFHVSFSRNTIDGFAGSTGKCIRPGAIDTAEAGFLQVPIWRRAISTCQICGRIFRIYVKNAVEKAIVVSGQFFNITRACRLS